MRQIPILRSDVGRKEVAYDEERSAPDRQQTSVKYIDVIADPTTHRTIDGRC